MEQETRRPPDTRQGGAVRELAEDASSRKRFLRMVGGTGAVGAFSIFLAACGDDENGASGSGSTNEESSKNGGKTTNAADMKGDLAIANYALTLEYLEAQFYRDAADSGQLKGKVLDVAKRFGDHEQAHVDALKATIEQMGGTPAKKPRGQFPLESQDQILELAATVENLGAAAYLGQADKIKSKEILAAALSIHTVEARHAAALNMVIGKKITPDGAFAKPASMDEVLKAVKPFIAS